MAAYGGMKMPEKGLVPYLISGPLSRESSLAAYFDTTLHLGTWVAVWVLEIITFVMLSRHEENVFMYSSGTKNSPMIAVSIGSLVTLSIATAVIVLVLGAHLMTNGIEDGKLPPTATSLITGGVKASIFFSIMVAITSFLIFMMEDWATTSTAVTCTTRSSCSHKSAATLLVQEENFLNLIVALLLLKFYGLSMIINNLRFAVSADQSDPSQMFVAHA